MLRIDGAAGSHWIPQRSSTLLDWQTVGRITLETAPLEIQVTPEVETYGFWRLAEPDQQRSFERKPFHPKPRDLSLVRAFPSSLRKS